MTNWDRAPKAINVARFLFDGQRRLVLDKARAGESLPLLKKQDLLELQIESEGDPLVATAHLCQRERAVLITANSSFMKLIFSESKGLGECCCCQVTRQNKQIPGDLTVRSSEEGMKFTEYVRRNRMILDVRYECPPPRLRQY